MRKLNISQFRIMHKRVLHTGIALSQLLRSQLSGYIRVPILLLDFVHIHLLSERRGVTKTGPRIEKGTYKTRQNADGTSYKAARHAAQTSSLLDVTGRTDTKSVQNQKTQTLKAINQCLQQIIKIINQPVNHGLQTVQNNSKHSYLQTTYRPKGQET